MRWPFSSRDPQGRGDAATGGGPGVEDRPGLGAVLPRQFDPSTRHPTAGDGVDGDTALPLLAQTIGQALCGQGDVPPAAVGVLVDGPPAVDGVAHRGATPTDPVTSELLARLAHALPVRRLLTVATGPDPVDVHELDALGDRLVGVDALIAIGSARTVDAARVLAAGGRSLGSLYAGRGGSQCLLPLADPIRSVAVPAEAFGDRAAGAVVVRTDVGRLVLTGESLQPRQVLASPGAVVDPGRVAAAGLAMVGRFLGPWHGAGLPAPQRAVFDVRSLLGAVLDLRLDPSSAAGSAIGARWAELERRAARVGGPPGRPCSWWLWPIAHEWATITDQPLGAALGALLPSWLDEVAAGGVPDEQIGLWHEAAIPARPFGARVRLTEADLRIVLRRVDRWWRPIGPGIPDADQLHRIFGLRRRSTT